MEISVESWVFARGVVLKLTSAYCWYKLFGL